MQCEIRNARSGDTKPSFYLSAMYGNSYGSYSSPPPELSNNPFIDHSSNALTRYPEVGGLTSSTDPQFASWVGQSSGVPQQQGYNTYNQQPAQQQYAANWGGSPPYQTQGSGFAYPQQTSGGGGTQFQPSSFFGQQLSSAIDAGGFIQGGPGYQQQQLTSGYGIPNGYNAIGGTPGQIQIPVAPYQQTGLVNPGYPSEFDPYASIGQGNWEGQQQQQRQQQQQQQQQQGGGLTKGGTLNPQTDLHPNEFIRNYKTELETWDAYAWKQLMNSLDSLKEAWEKRMKELDGRVKQLSTNWGAAAQQELAQYKSVRFLVSFPSSPFE